MAQLLVKAIRLALGVILIVACGSDNATIELTPFDEVSWPTPSAPPACEPWSETFSIPALAPVTGKLRISTSSVLIPVQELERIEVRVLSADSSLDETAGGALHLAPIAGMEIVSEGVVTRGYGEVVVRLSQIKTYALALSLDGDTRVGSIEVLSYQPQIPVWNLLLSPQSFAEIVTSPLERIKVDAELQIDGSSYASRLRIHGGASREFPKKSFRLDLQGSALKSGQKHLILRSEYNDKTMLRTYLGYEFFRNGTMIPTPQIQFVHLRINHRYYGLMLHAERIDEHFLSRNGLSERGNLYEADPPPGFTVPGGNLSVLGSLLEYYQVYQWHTGPGAWQDLIDFIEFTLIFPDLAFDQVIATEVRLDDYIPYLAMMAVLQNHEHIRKNYYLYRDPDAADTRWIFFPWDLDMTMGHLWSAIDSVFDERIISDADLFVGEQAPERFGYFNQLTDRVLKSPVLRDRFLKTVRYLLEHSVTQELLDARIAYATCLIEPDLLADSRKWAKNSEYLDSVEELRTFLRERRIYIEGILQSNGLGLRGP